ncbi:24207_t:CDS:2, partial [Racocetra persica]
MDSNKINIEEYFEEAYHGDIDIEKLIMNVKMVILRKGYLFSSFDDANNMYDSQANEGDISRLYEELLAKQQQDPSRFRKQFQQRKHILLCLAKKFAKVTTKGRSKSVSHHKDNINQCLTHNN